MDTVKKRFLKGEPVDGLDLRSRPVESERIAAILDHVRRRERR